MGDRGAGVVFSSTAFLFIFLPLCLAFYFAVPSRWTAARNLVLFLFSLLFYVWGEAWNCALILASIAVNHALALLIALARADGPGDWRARALLGLGIALNLAVLGYYKYSSWLLREGAGLLAGLGLPLAAGLDSVALPLGISFFTFHAISYIMDVHRGEITVPRNPLSFACYFAMFPHLVAGPIVRYAHVAEDMEARRIDLDLFSSGVQRFVIGLAKKVLIANHVAAVADAAFGHPAAGLGPAAAWLGIAAYSLQIYFDFSAYSDMAIGLARMFGFHFQENFNHPYGAASIQEFWQRWHISLSSWLRDYLYIPLGGNRRGRLKTYRNLVLVFLICGLWHGANWTFLAWGLFHGLLLVLERLGLSRLLARSPAVPRHAYVLLAVMVGWVLFRSDSLGHAGAYLAAMFDLGRARAMPPEMSQTLTPWAWAALVVGAAASPGLGKTAHERLSAVLSGKISDAGWQAARLGYLMACLLLSSMFLVAGGYNPFIYFRF